MHATTNRRNMSRLTTDDEFRMRSMIRDTLTMWQQATTTGEPVRGTPVTRQVLRQRACVVINVSPLDLRRGELDWLDRQITEILAEQPATVRGMA